MHNEPSYRAHVEVLGEPPGVPWFFEMHPGIHELEWEVLCFKIKLPTHKGQVAEVWKGEAQALVVAGRDRAVQTLVVAFLGDRAYFCKLARIDVFVDGVPNLSGEAK
jgi:hypothetical protein